MKLKKFASILLALVMMLALATPAYAAKPVKGNAQSNGPVTVALKGATTDTGELEDGEDYGPEVWTTWKNVHYVGGATGTAFELPAWHLVYAGKGDINATQKVHLTFVNADGKEVVWEWTPKMGFSTNAGGKNPGWMIVAPAGWTLISGKNQTKSYIVAGGAAGQFNISGYHDGINHDPEITPVKATINIQKYIGDETVTPTYESFMFQILNAEGTEVGTITTDKQGVGSTDVTVVPGTYTIHEVMTDSQTQRFTAEDMTVEITAEENATYEVAFVNEVTDETGETSTVFQINKYLNEFGTPGVGFTFDIYAVEGAEEILIETITSDEMGIAATEDFWVEPGTYIIREQVPTDEEYEYEAVSDIYAIVNDAGAVTYQDAEGNPMEMGATITNVQKGKLDVTVPTEAYQQHIKQVHETEYRWYGEGEGEGTLVSYIGDFANSEVVVKTGTYNNGFTYLGIDKSKLADSQDGLTVRIADSSKSNALAPAMKDSGNAPTYNLQINEDGKLVITSDLDAFTVHVLAAPGSKHPSPGTHYSGEIVRNIPSTADGIFYVFYHAQTEYKDNGQGAPYETNEAIGCKLVSTEIVENVFNCDLVTTVTAANGDVVDANEQLSAGKYTVIVEAKVDGETVDSWTEESVEVKPGETTTLDFGKLILHEMAEPEIECNYNGCPGFIWLTITPAVPVEP